MAVIQQRLKKKASRYFIEVYNTKLSSLPHQLVEIDQDILELYNVEWEPHFSHLAIHAKVKKQKEVGKKGYTDSNEKDRVIIYKMSFDDKLKALKIQYVGIPPGDRVEKISWSSVGDVFVLLDVESGVKSANFYFITLKR